MKKGKTILYRVYQAAMALALRVLPEKKQELVTGNGNVASLIASNKNKIAEKIAATMELVK